MSATNGREPEDPPVGARRGDVLLLDELHAVGDELGPPVEATGIHRPEPALHVRHDLVLGLPDEQRQARGRPRARRRRAARPRATGHERTRSSRAPLRARARRAPARADARVPGHSSWPSPGSLAPGHGFEARAARTNDLRSGVPSKPSGSSSGRRPRPGAVVEAVEVDAEHLVGLALVPGGPAEDAGQRRHRQPLGGARAQEHGREARRARDGSMRWHTTSKPARSSRLAASVWSTAVSQSK